MIQVNLLPLQLRPIKHSAIPYLLSALAFVAGVSFIFSLYVAKQVEIAQQREEQEQLTYDLSQLKDVIDESERLEKLKGRLSSKRDTIQEIATDRVIWSRHLFNLSRLAPRNFWYSEIRVDKEKLKETRQEPDPKNKNKTREVVVEVQKPVLIVKGYVSQGEDGMMDTNPLLQATTQDAEFSEVFELKPPSWGSTMYEGVPVNSFTFTYWIRQGGGSS